MSEGSFELASNVNKLNNFIPTLEMWPKKMIDHYCTM